MKLAVWKPKSIRAPRGVYMIELIMAIAVSSMLAAALVGVMADTERLSTAGQNQIVAAAVAQELIDNIRNTLYGTPTQTGSLIYGAQPGSSTTYTMLLNMRTASDSAPPAVPRPLLFDLLDYDWRTPAEKADGASQINCQASNQFQLLGSDATVTETVTNNGGSNLLNGTATVTITVTWSEGQAQKKYTVSTLVSQSGIHIY